MPQSRKKIRKQAYDLVIADLERFPLWESCFDEEDQPGQDECTMRPLEARASVSFPRFYGWVTTDFTTPSGKELIGVLQPGGKTLWELNPELFLSKPPGKRFSRHRLLQDYNSILTSDTARIC